MKNFISKIVTIFSLTILLALPTVVLAQTGTGAKAAPVSTTSTTSKTTPVENWDCEALKQQITDNGGGRSTELPKYCSEGEVYKKIAKLIDTNKEIIKDAKPTVHKNSAGYFIWNVENQNIFDLNKLLVGSQGTLAIVTEATLRLRPAPPPE